jgi:hypothetical protein
MCNVIEITEINPAANFGTRLCSKLQGITSLLVRDSANKLLFASPSIRRALLSELEFHNHRFAG